MFSNVQSRAVVKARLAVIDTEIKEAGPKKEQLQRAADRKETAQKEAIEAKKNRDLVVQKGRTRPLLVDSYNEKNKKNLAMMKATKDYVQTFKNESEGVKRLTEEQKESYEYGKFIDA